MHSGALLGCETAGTRLFLLWSQHTPLLRGRGIQSGSSKPTGQARRMVSYQQSSLPSAWVKSEWDKSQVSNRSSSFGRSIAFPCGLILSLASKAMAARKDVLRRGPQPLTASGTAESRSCHRGPGRLPSCPILPEGCSDEGSILS